MRFEGVNPRNANMDKQMHLRVDKYQSEIFTGSGLSTSIQIVRQRLFDSCFGAHEALHSVDGRYGEIQAVRAGTPSDSDGAFITSVQSTSTVQLGHLGILTNYGDLGNGVKGERETTGDLSSRVLDGFVLEKNGRGSTDFTSESGVGVSADVDVLVETARTVRVLDVEVDGGEILENGCQHENNITGRV